MPEIITHRRQLLTRVIYAIGHIENICLFSLKVLTRSGGIGELVALRWDLTLTLLLAWTLIFLCLLKGIKTSGKVSHIYVHTRTHVHTFKYYIKFKID